MTSPTIVWYRNDFRLSDHRPLLAARHRDRPIIPVYIFDDTADAKWPAGAASAWWLHHSLKALDSDLRHLGSRLIIRRGHTLSTLLSLISECNAGALYCHRSYEPDQIALETRLTESLTPPFDLRRFPGRLLHEPESVHTAAGKPFKVFTPFWKACLKLSEPPEPIPAPRHLKAVPENLETLPLGKLNLCPTQPNWAEGIGHHWQPGETTAHRRLDMFVDSNVNRYSAHRDHPSISGTSRLSPHLHFGELSANQIWHAIRQKQSILSGTIEGGDAFLRELGWREFCHHLLFHWPDITQHPFSEKFAAFPWSNDDQAFRAWRRGNTGYPLVDAGMRELWTTGWMHNRVRMITASFLVKHLMIPWQRGAAWFWDTLVDADLANNTCGWQWVAGCGADAAPYFRIFNPVLQGSKFDSTGDYVRRWVPEIAGLPNSYLHRPFDAPAKTLSASGVRLGGNYSYPIVEHAFARARALDALKTMQNAHPK